MLSRMIRKKQCNVLNDSYVRRRLHELNYNWKNMKVNISSKERVRMNVISSRQLENKNTMPLLNNDGRIDLGDVSYERVLNKSLIMPDAFCNYGNLIPYRPKRPMNSLINRSMYNLCVMNTTKINSKYYNMNGIGNFSVSFFSTNTNKNSSDENSQVGCTSSFSTASIQSSIVQKSMMKRMKCAIKSATKSFILFLRRIPGLIWFYLTNPSDLKEKLLEIKEAAKKEAHHYWMGSKLLVVEIRTAKTILQRTLEGSTLTRRERQQLLRTTTDLFRLVPFSIFVIIPFMEFALPFALKIFPNMLPSTFQDSLKLEENMKRELKSRIAMASFFQETLQNLAKEQKCAATIVKESNKKEELSGDEVCLNSKREETAASFLEFLNQARNGEAIPPDIIIKYSKYFHDDLTLDNMSRMQLINMCKYMGIPPYGTDPLLRFQLRHRIRSLREDDQRILWEGIDSLTKIELREACRERGMRSVGLSKGAYKLALQQWIDLSVNKHVPVSLLIMSRTFYLREEMENKLTVKTEKDKNMVGIADAISGLEKGVVNEVVLDVASSLGEQRNSDVMKIKLEILNTQNELINEENKERKREKEREKEKEVADTKIELSTSENAPLEDNSKESIIETDEKAIKDDSLDAKEVAISETKTTVEPYEQEEGEEEEPEKELSTEEMEAISQLICPNAVNSEREELERIKEAMSSTEQHQDIEATIPEKKDTSSITPSTSITQKIEYVSSDTSIEELEPISSEMADSKAAKTISEMDTEASRVASESTVSSFSQKEDTKKSEQKESKEEDFMEEDFMEEDSGSGDEKLDKSVARLKSSVEAMVGKIERQLTDVESKIGDKLHLLDKDGDGVMSNEELTLALKQVLKRKITEETAMSIVKDMDENKDGTITIAEFSKWIETHKFDLLREEGRDADLDREIEKKLKKKVKNAESSSDP